MLPYTYEPRTLNKCGMDHSLALRTGVVAGEEIIKKGVDRANGDKSVNLFDKVR